MICEISYLWFSLVCTAWLISLLPSLPCLFIFGISVKTLGQDLLGACKTREECVSNFSGWSKIVKKFYFSALFLAIFVIPLSIMFSLYTHMLVHLRDNYKSSQRIKLMEMGDVKIKVNQMYKRQL